MEVDTALARRRVKAGRPAFDALELLQGAGDLHRPFQRAAEAFELAGLATADQVWSARTQPLATVMMLGASWLAGEPLPRLEPRRLSQRAAAVVVGAVLSSAAGKVRTTVRSGTEDRSACPACGCSPEFSIVGPSGRMLTCARCDTRWRTVRKGCLGCGAHDSPTVARIPSPDVGYDLVVCNGCGRYMKERTRRGGSDLLVERALTSQLDAAAERRGLRL
ncbi:MAG: formate dehydrogenase accessory protein FdhE [Gemmatimonadaceae bacterium]|nr:formate dehydrogenase accessory protein FdhE [Gemmatimonadaceae bacterium]